MEWLLYLLCPLMMLFCMKGMFTGGKKDCHSKQVNVQNSDMKSLQMEVENLREQNVKLMNTMKAIEKQNENTVTFIAKDIDSNQKITS